MPPTLPPSSKKRSSTFAALQNIEFRWLVISNAAFFLVMHGQTLTRSFLAWDMTGNEMSLAAINAAYAVPMIFFSLIGGALTDRIERRQLIQWGQLIVLASESCILVLLATQQLEFWHLIIAGIVGGVVIPVIMPARTAVVFDIVGQKRLGAAMGLSMAVVNISRVIGPMLMGWAISVYAATGAYIVATLLLFAAFLAMLKLSPKPVARMANSESRLSLYADVVAGLRYIGGQREIIVCLLFGFLPMLLAIPFQNVLILFADNVWAVGETGLGVLMAVSGLGGVLGSFWIAARGENVNRSKLMVANGIGSTLFLVAFSITGNFYLALVPLLLANLCASAAQTLNNTTMQLLVDNNQRGRVSALMMMAFGFTPLGVVPLAWMAQYIGIAATTAVAGATLALIIVTFYLTSVTLRTLDDKVRHSLREA
ncbi:MAG: MFS transporter [Gammaproteobacteria bacterium]|nr:MFS transporter [Gammaproteobacteria bacterium]MBT8151308.1 MFS transporter [Gammaproteobacteria bacterium]NND39360.1 MFS transporter [Pseudomonadales bacterium]NNM10507.1 MFS transporter [Pseudomonadales bacterium]